jgi:hypothetical protein
MKTRYFSSFTKCLALSGVVAVSSAAHAVHLTTLTLSPSLEHVLPGNSVSYLGSVGTNTDCGLVSSYASSLTSAGGPSGSTHTLTPSGSPVNGPLSYNYTLDIFVPDGSDTGTYPVIVGASFAASGCTSGSKNANATLHVIAGNCPAGGNWSLQEALGPDDPFDKNGDGHICTKDIPGKGEGNSANRKGASDVGHLDGHNHKDNNN